MNESLESAQLELDTLAQEVLSLSRDTLLVNLRFLDLALNRFDFVARPECGIATDGTHIYYDARSVLRDYQTDEKLCARNFLHMLLHCVFRHNFVSTLVDRALWDLACDIAVESAIIALNTPAVLTSRQAGQLDTIRALQTHLKKLTADRIYDYYLDQKLTDDQLEHLSSLFYADNHDGWYLPPVIEFGDDPSSGGQGPASDDSQEGSGGEGSGGDGDSDSPSQDDGPIGNDAPITRTQSDLDQISYNDAETYDFWKDTAERMQTDLETFSRQHSDTDSALFQNLRAVNREKYDYASFLRKFAVMGETMSVNHDEFDYIFYTYGMSLFGRMPLIQPLEYKENHRIREFVVAIDTSGSTSGELVQKFIQKTYNLLMQEESFFQKINLHIIQCDEEIQEDVKITTKEEFERYLKNMKLLGFGNTDFRPVFSYVDELRQAREFVNLKGLIYFTDGFGTFPEKKPDYSTAFVFIDQDNEVPDVPPWAIRLVLEPEEIEAL